jgi:hypothetical protein
MSEVSDVAWLHGDRGLGNSREGQSTTTEKRKKRMSCIEIENYYHVVKNE